ncbi:ABC transporter permease [Nocardioides sp. YIM 152588]|uniref:ABC transporter permease n=1 Tax=Nocardioides sp. YIM 152588 TaxID=3158259 RepID=UPI0032E4EF94
MLSYLLAGLALGSIYAIAAGSLVVTYIASGVFNLAFAAMAFTVARVYYELHVEHEWGIVGSAAFSLLVFAPLFGTLLYALLFRFLQGRSTVVKLMATVGLSVALPPLVELALGKLTAVTAPGLAPLPLKVFHVFGATVNADQVATYVGLAVVLVVGVGVLRFTDVGLKVRALVDSGALTSLSGSNPSRISMGVWAVSTTLAGLAGILIAPTAGLHVAGMTGLMAAAFAAVVAARLRNLPLAIGIALAMGLVTTVPQKWITPDGAFAQAFIPSVPFLFMFVALVYYALRGMTGDVQTGGPLDRAIKAEGGDPSAVPAPALRFGRVNLGVALPVVFVGVVALLPQVLDVYWTGLVATGIVLGIILLSYTLVTGEGGMVWLCQISFAGIGALLVGEFATTRGWDPLVAVVVAPLLVVPVGVLIGLLTIRLGELYVALVTLTAGLLAQTLVITEDRFYNYGSGVFVSRPTFALENAAFAYLALAAFVVFGLLVLNLRRSTAGMALGAVRWSEDGARTIGISVVQSKVLVSAFATYVAALGGGFMAMNYQSTLPDSWAPFAGMVWLAVLLTLGARSIMAALLAGLLYALMPGIFATYLPVELGEVPVILFGVGAIALAAHPEGAIAQTAGNIARSRARRQVRRSRSLAAAPAPEKAGVGELA